MNISCTIFHFRATKELFAMNFLEISSQTVAKCFFSRLQIEARLQRNTIILISIGLYV